MTSDVLGRDAHGQAEAVRSGEVSPAELVAAAVDAAQRLDPELGSIIHPRYESALAEARSIDPGLPFAGVPMVVKDLDGTLAGEPYHGGTIHLRDAGYVATETSWMFQRLIDAGFVIIGKTNTPELGLVTTTEPVAHGPSRNPWNTAHSTGGSSGGSAAAVAAGIVPIGHAGDGGGSIRVPASECGLVGLKPSRARVSIGPAETEAWAGLVCRLAVTRSVADTAAILDLMSGPRAGDPYGVATPSRPFADEVGAGRSGLRIGMALRPPDGSTVHPDVDAVVRHAADVLAGMGHRVEESAPEAVSDADAHAALSADFFVVYPVWVAAELDHLGALTGQTVTASGVEPGTWAIAELGRSVSGVDYFSALDRLRGLARTVETWWSTPDAPDGFDLLLTPTIPEPPPTLGQFVSTHEEPLAGVMRSASLVGFVAPFNVTGQPAISIPLGMSSDGLPIGVQLVAAIGREDLLVDIAAQLEVADPWSDRHPGIWAG